jgi:hypothetical protein
MPNRKQHLKASKNLLGYSNSIVHDILDKYLPIEEHRRTHNPQTIKQIGALLGKEAETEAWLHFFMDYHFIIRDD